MARHRGTSLALICAVAATTLSGAPAPRSDQVMADSGDAVFIVHEKGTLYDGTTDDEQGTGFFISDTGTALTAAHVLFSDASIYQKVELTAEVAGIGSLPAKVVNIDKVNDIALLDVQVSSKVRQVVMASASKVSKGTLVDIIGYPIGFTDSMIVSGVVSSKPKPNAWTTDAAVNPGTSGAPVFRDSDGKAIGLVVSGATSVKLSDGTTYALEGIKYFVPLDVYHAPGGAFYCAGADEQCGGSNITEVPVDSKSRPTRARPQSFTLGYHVDFEPPQNRSGQARKIVFSAQEGYQIGSVIGWSIIRQRQASVPTVTVSEDRKLLTVSLNIDSGGFFEATVLTKQVRGPR